MIEIVIMKKNNIAISIVLCTAMLLTLSCKKYLEVKSNAKLVIPHTLSDVQGLLDDANL